MNNTTEAPMSVTLQAYYKGFSVLITKRDPDVNVQPLIKQSMEAIEHLIKIGFSPSWNQASNKEWLSPDAPVVAQQVTTQVPLKTHAEKTFSDDFCNVHDAAMKGRIGKEDKVFYSHSRGVYPKLEWCNGRGFPSDKNLKETLDKRYPDGVTEEDMPENWTA